MSKIVELYKKSFSNDPSFNEFYTLTEEAEKFLKPYKKYLEGKKVYCPCDSEDSAIVKYLKNNVDCEVFYQYEKDFNSEEIRTEMLKCDVIVTNPPFKMKELRPLVEFILENNLDFILWGSTYNATFYFNFAHQYDFQRVNMHPYLNNKGEIKYAPSRLYSSFPVKHSFTIREEKRHPIDYMPWTQLFYYDKDEYEYVGRAKQRNPKDFARFILRKK